jgi:hypothetical protein
MAKESAIQKAIKDYLNSLPYVRAVNVHGGKYGNNGEPDIDCSFRGRTVKIEVKKPGEKPKPIQQRVMNMWRKTGAIVFVATSKEEVKEKLEWYGLLNNGRDEK